ncbi:hypothetical protein ACVDFE_00325 [Lentzea chajnantorensis]
MKTAAAALAAFLLVYVIADSIKGDALQEQYDQQHPQPSVQTADWVVESSGFHGPRGAGTHRVTCVPPADLARPREERQRWKDVKVTQETASSAEAGDPCPSGPVLELVG